MGRRMDGSPDILSIEQAEEAECHHVPVGAVVVAHQVQGQRHMRMAVVTAEIVLEMQEGWGQAGLWGKLPLWFPSWLLPLRSSSPTMRCLYSSEASCTAVSHALGPLAYT